MGVLLACNQKVIDEYVFDSEYSDLRYKVWLVKMLRLKVEVIKKL